MPRNHAIARRRRHSPIRNRAVARRRVHRALMRTRRSCRCAALSSAVVHSRPGQALRRFRRRRPRFARRRPRRDLRIPRTQRRGQIHHHPHPVRPARRRPPARHRSPASTCAREPEADPQQHRLHVAEVFALRRSHRRREHRLLRRHLRRSAGPLARARRLCAGMAGLDEKRSIDDAAARRRMEAAAGARLRDPARAADSVPG